MSTCLSIFKLKFWDLFAQKLLRNLASMKFQWLMLLYIPIVWGMFQGKWVENIWVAKIPPSLGLGLLGGGFVTLALGRIYAQTKLKENDDEMNSTKEIEDEGDRDS